MILVDVNKYGYEGISFTSEKCSDNEGNVYPNQFTNAKYMLIREYEATNQCITSWNENPLWWACNGIPPGSKIELFSFIAVGAVIGKDEIVKSGELWVGTQ